MRFSILLALVALGAAQAQQTMRLTLAEAHAWPSRITRNFPRRSSPPPLPTRYWVHPGWFLFTAFVGLNLFQSAFTNWCPMITFLRKLGVQSSEGRVKA